MSTQEHVNVSASAFQVPFQLNEDQSLALESLIEFISNPDASSWYFAFRGFAGTGKTSCMREVVARFKNSAINFAFTAPTNKAAKVLRQITGEACTVYSLLGLRVDKSGELKQVVSGKKPDLSNIDVVFVDEASQVNTNLFSILRAEAENGYIKIVFIGDLAQLPPVGEAVSPSLREGEDVLGCKLTRVMRHDNQILTLVTEIRERMNSFVPTIKLKADNDGEQGVWKLPSKDFKVALYNAAERGDFADGVHSKVVSWRNVKVAEYNSIIRAGIYGAAAIPGYFLAGDRVVAAGPCERGDEFLLSTDDEAIVESVVECVHPLEPKYKAIELKCTREDNKSVRLLVIHPHSQLAFNNDSQQLAHEARAYPKGWKKFWEHKELFHDVRYAYALTAHRAQGSTYENVYVDSQDILYNRNRKEAFQCLYVACSRPTTRLFML